MMPKTQEQRNALISTARRCNEELKAAMNQKPKPKFDAVSRPLLKKHFEKLKALGIPFTLFTWTIGVMNKQFRECGEDIPELRRVAVPGCQTCASCQADLELIRKQRGF